MLITGITGTLGTEITKQLLEMYPGVHIVGISRDEYKQSRFKYRNDVELILGDIRDYEAVSSAIKGTVSKAQMIYHFAAMKHVDLGEIHVDECVKTNIIGTQNLCRAQKQQDVYKIVMASTDKACYPINVYGCAKQIAEKAVLRSNEFNTVCRYGNVLNSRGSVIEKFAEKIRKGETIQITSTDMTRFWIRIEDAAKFIIDKSEHSKSNAGIHVPPIKAATLLEIVAALEEAIGYECKREITGLRLGEKLHECLRMNCEGEAEITSDKSEQFSKEELLKVVKEVLDAGHD